MKNVTVNGKKWEVFGNKSVMLNNGDLVLHYNRMGVCLGAYLVISFRDNENKYYGSNTQNYCSFVDLDSGKFKFEERCSRHSTIGRILSHLNRHNDKGESACKEGQYVKIYRRNSYQIDLNFEESEEV